MIDIRTYIVHYTRLTERKTHIINQMKNFDFSNYLFYEQYDKDDLTEKDISDHYVSGVQNPGLWQEKISLWGSDTRAGEKLKVLNPAEISVTIKFGKILQELSKFDDEYFIVFDDDVILCDNFEERLN